MRCGCQCARVCCDSFVLPSRHAKQNTLRTDINSGYGASTWTGLLLLTVAALCCTQEVTVAAECCTSMEANFKVSAGKDSDST